MSELVVKVGLDFVVQSEESLVAYVHKLDAWMTSHNQIGKSGVVVTGYRKDVWAVEQTIVGVFNRYFFLVAAINYVERVVREATDQKLTWTQLHNLTNLLTFKVLLWYDLHLRALNFHKVKSKLSSKGHLQRWVRLHSLSSLVVFLGYVVGFHDWVDVAKLSVLYVSDITHLVVATCLLAYLPSQKINEAACLTTYNKTFDS